MNGFVRLSVSVLMLSMFACGTLEISVEGTPMPDIAATGTVSALQAQNAELATRIAMLNPPVGTSTPVPATLPTSSSPVPTVAVSAATRISFLNGATVGVVSEPIDPSQIRTYVLDAFKTQPMFVYVGSQNSDVAVSIQTENGISILSPAAHQTSWQGTLPQTGAYYLTVYGGATTENFSLTVTVPSRIQFPQGADSATVQGKTVADYDVSYTVLAAKGQTLRVSLGDLSSKASISIYGFTDGKYYVRSNEGQRSVRLVLPATQDYIIVVVPAAGNEVNFSLTVTIG